MRALCRSGPWVVALGVALAGCSNPNGPVSKGPARPSPSDAASTEASVGAPDVTLMVPGMT